MNEVRGPLAELIHRLDELHPEPSLVNLAGALEATPLSAADVAPFVKHTVQSYHRAVVVRRPHYECLVLTWMPGQGSVPHDHAGSVSAMLVLQGEAAEGCWRIAPDGYADLEYETRVRSGELTAWQDAGVHTVRNLATNHDVLVTVNVYAPPLKEFRRFVQRPAGLKADLPVSASDVPTVVIVGGGFSGTMSAAQILRQSGETGTPVRVAVVERLGAVGEGLAYGTRDTAHLLNVPAGRMSAWPDRPNDFVEWASQRHGAVQPSDFLPRQWYGEYVREALLATSREAGESARLLVLLDEVRRIARCPGGGWMVHFARGASLPAAAVVLAVGHRPPPDPIGKLWSGPRNRFIADPWHPFATNLVGPDEPVVVLGSGLTAVDTILSLSRLPRQAPITLISRRGLIPHAHADSPVTAADLSALIVQLLDSPGGLRVKGLLDRVRRKIAEVTAAGGDWRSVVDGLRPQTAKLWKALASAERRKFLTHLRPFWEVHRHRMAVDVAARFDALRAQGLVKIVAGRVAGAQADDGSVRLYVRERGDERLLEMRAAWVVNCTGPTASNSAESNPAIGSLLVHGWIRPDELALGLETTAEGYAVDANGAVAHDLFVVGTLRKPSVWESTAVPELRSQAESVAGRVLEHLNRVATLQALPAGSGSVT